MHTSTNALPCASLVKLADIQLAADEHDSRHSTPTSVSVHRARNNVTSAVGQVVFFKTHLCELGKAEASGPVAVHTWVEGPTNTKPLAHAMEQLWLVNLLLHVPIVPLAGDKLAHEAAWHDCVFWKAGAVEPFPAMHI